MLKESDLGDGFGVDRLMLRDTTGAKRLYATHVRIPVCPFPMSAFETVNKLVKEWQPQASPTELAYRNSLAGLLRERLPKAKIETEYRHNGTTVDIYAKEPGLFSSTEVFVELKRNLLHKAQLDRLVGQIESLQPGKNAILVVLCGDTNPALVTRFKEKYGIAGKAIVFGPGMGVVVKSDREAGGSKA